MCEMSLYLSLQVLTTLLKLGLGSASCHGLNRPGSDTDRAQPQAGPPPFSPRPSLRPFSLLPSCILPSSVLFFSISTPFLLSCFFSILPSVFPSFSSPHSSASFLSSFVFLSPSLSPLPPFPPPLFSLLSSPSSVLYQDSIETLQSSGL